MRSYRINNYCLLLGFGGALGSLFAGTACPTLLPVLAVVAAQEPNASAPPAAAAEPMPTPAANATPVEPQEVKPDDPPARPPEPPKLDSEGNLQRPAAPPSPPDRDELKTHPDADGRVRFHFRGQPWPEVLEWLANISGTSLDWQDLPGDYLNLTTRRSYTVEEARDLLNRHLLARGYTMLQTGEVLNVVNVKKLDPGMVPRIEPEELLRRLPNEYVRVSFPLETLVADQAVEEFRPMLSPNGRLTALKSTNRLEAVDTVANLRSLYKVLGDEQSVEEHDRHVREFELEHAKAADVQQQLLKLLSADEKSIARSGIPIMPGMTPDQLQQMAAQQAELVAQSDRRGGSTMMAKPKIDVSIVVNTRRNSVLALAPPDKMAIISQAVKIIDVPSDGSHTLNAQLQRMQVYRLAALEPAAVVRILEEAGGLDPSTKLQVDERNKAVVAYASLADQMVIRAVLEKLDGTSRRFHVLPLRRLEADEVAGTIEFMMGIDDKQAQNGNRNGSDARRGERRDEDRDKFRVDVDIERNRLLLWANDLEVEEVSSLLVKLGEAVERGGAGGAVGGSLGANVRVLPLGTDESSAEVLEMLRRIWPTLAPNPLIVPSGSSSNRGPKTTPRDTPSDAVKPARGVEPARETKPVQDSRVDKNTRVTPSPGAAQPTSTDSVPTGDRTADRQRQVLVSTAQWTAARTNTPAATENCADEQTQDDAEQSKPVDAAPQPSAAALPPVRVDFTADGRVMISSADAEALDMVEELVGQWSQGKKDFQVFQLEYAQAYWVKSNIQEFFAEDESDKKNDPRNRGNSSSSSQAKGDVRRRLSKRRALKMISDPDTNTILVAGADEHQLRTIGELIKLYDQPEPVDSKTERVSTIYEVRWSKAQTIADAVKDMYRDLLSANDKALVAGTDPRNRPQSQSTYIYGDGKGGNKKTQVSFKGKISLGVDEVSNTLLISTEGETLMANVMKMVKTLDEAARPAESIQMLRLEGGMNAATMRRAIQGVLSDTGSAGMPSDPTGGVPGMGGRNGNRRGPGFGPGGAGAGVPTRRP